MADLVGPRRKLGRAQQHFRRLEQEIRRIGSADPYCFISEPNPQPPKYLLFARPRVPIPEDWDFLVGELAHNARGALDHLVYNLSTKIPDHRLRKGMSQFPIFDDPDAYRKNEDRYLVDVSRNDRIIIEGFQPYHNAGGVDADPLYWLQELNNADKHRLIVVFGAIGKNISVRLTGQIGDSVFPSDGGMTLDAGGAEASFGGFIFRTTKNRVIAESGTPIAEFEMDGPMNVQLHPKTTFDPQFGPSCPVVDHCSVMDTLTTILDRVKEVIGKF